MKMRLWWLMGALAAASWCGPATARDDGPPDGGDKTARMADDDGDRDSPRDRWPGPRPKPGWSGQWRDRWHDDGPPAARSRGQDMGRDDRAPRDRHPPMYGRDWDGWGGPWGSRGRWEDRGAWGSRDGRDGWREQGPPWMWRHDGPGGPPMFAHRPPWLRQDRDNWPRPWMGAPGGHRFSWYGRDWDRRGGPWGSRGGWEDRGAWGSRGDRDGWRPSGPPWMHGDGPSWRGPGPDWRRDGRHARADEEDSDYRPQSKRPSKPPHERDDD